MNRLYIAPIIISTSPPTDLGNFGKGFDTLAKSASFLISFSASSKLICGKVLVSLSKQIPLRSTFWPLCNGKVIWNLP